MKALSDKDRLLDFDLGITGLAESYAGAQSFMLSLYF